MRRAHALPPVDCTAGPCQLAGAKNLSEMVELQAAYWQKLLGTLASQAEEVRALSTKLVAAAGEPLKDQVKRGVDELRKAN